MTLVALGQSKDPTDPEGLDLRAAAEIVEETLEECRFLLAEADRTASAVRAQAEEDAACTRREAAAHAAQQIEGALSVAARVTEEAGAQARKIVGDAHARRGEVEQQITAIRRASRTAAAYIDSTMRDADLWAARRKDESETEAVALLEATWRASSELQTELVEEAEAEAAEILGRADAEAAAARDEARRLREGARLYADELLVASLAAPDVDPEPEREQSGAARRRFVRSAARRLVPVAVVILMALVI